MMIPEFEVELRELLDNIYRFYSLEPVEEDWALLAEDIIHLLREVNEDIYKFLPSERVLN